ncbi:MAG: hypothetical protein HY508_10290 [Acidobacteria bacterium]|nr:hypothetical protein [Acidobacteriota bacterium]
MISKDQIDRRRFLQGTIGGAAGLALPEAEAGAAHSAEADEPALSVEAGKCNLRFDNGGNIRKIGFQDKVFELPSPYSYFELDGELAEAEHLAGTKDLSFRLKGGKKRGTVTVSGDKEVRFRIAAEGKDTLKEAGLVLTFPAAGVFHLAEYLNIGRQLDKEMPVGESYTAQLLYNFLLAEHNGMWIRFRTDEKKSLSKAKCHIARLPEMFTVTFTWPADTEARLTVFSSMEEALNDYEKWLEAEAGARKLKDRDNTPQWVREIKLVVTVDMMRSDWEIAHDYSDLLNLAKQISEIRNPREVLFYVPGWQGAYDSTHPTYKPHPELGGDSKFRELTDYFHEKGFRLMIHTTGWGIDPYHPEIDALQKLAVRKEGRFQGFQIPDLVDNTWGPLSTPLKFRTPKISLRDSARKGAFSFQTDPVPARCEALFTLGGVKTKIGRVRLTVGRRTVSTPPGWFESHDAYDFPFPLALGPGENQVKVSAAGESAIDWSGSWYRIRYTFVPDGPYATETHPILMADMTNPEYIRIYTDNVSSVVRQYGIDAVHIDATRFDSAEEMLTRLKEKIPGVAIACEWSTTFKAMGYWTFWQGARQSLPDYAEIIRGDRRGTQELFAEFGSCGPSTLSPSGAEETEAYGWLDKPSAVCGFVRNYIIPYPHLCSASGFVPIGKVCNIFPPRLMPLHNEVLWKVLKDAKRLDYVPGLRVNYRKYGLDGETKKAIKDIASLS